MPSQSIDHQVIYEKDPRYKYLAHHHRQRPWGCEIQVTIYDTVTGDEHNVVTRFKERPAIEDMIARFESIVARIKADTDEKEAIE